MNTILITKDPKIAKYSIDSGVNLIMVDLEFIGKKDRQKNFDTILSTHSIDDVKIISETIPNSNLIVRVNPINENTESEIESVLEYMPKYIMLPMFKNKNDLIHVLKIIDGRSLLIPLIELPTAFMKLEDYLDLKNIGFFYFGLNDINIKMGNQFLFESIAYDLLKPYFDLLNKKKLSFGFGGMAKLNEGMLPGKLVLSEHIRHKSNYVILSRAFHNNSSTYDEFKKNVDLKNEIQLIENYINENKNNEKLLDDNHLKLKNVVSNIVNSDLLSITSAKAKLAVNAGDIALST